MNADQPAYPQHGWTNDPDLMRHQSGLTKREEFAKAAMQGLLANSSFSSRVSTSELITVAIDTADALLAELAKEKTL